MYHFFKLFLCFFYLACYSQGTPNDTIKKQYFSYTSHFKSVNTFKPLTPIFNTKTSGRLNIFSVYNNTTKLNDLYYVTKDSTKYIRTINMNDNQLSKRDSFNPYGISDFRDGVIMGSINTVYNLIFN